MARPRKSTFDAWIDTFADWPIADQEGALEVLGHVHRQKRRELGGKVKATVNGEPEQQEIPQ